MKNNERKPNLESSFGEYLVPIAGGTNNSFAPNLAGITYPNPDYEVMTDNSSIYTFEYIISGTGTVNEDSNTVYPKTGDVYIMHKGQKRHYYSDKNDPWTKIWINISGDFTGELLRLHGIENYLLIPGFNDGSHLEKILQTAEHGGDITGKIAFLLHDFIKELADFVKSDNKQKNPAYIMREYINSNIDKNISIDELCRITHHSKASAIHLFKRAFGITPYAYVMKCKVQMAETLLEKTELPIYEISQKIGFSNPHNFSTFFKSMTGKTPRSCRTKNTE